jgi:uncharacterized DUF497 family protein
MDASRRARADTDGGTGSIALVGACIGQACEHEIKSYIRREMRIVWDEPKRQTNIATHGLDLADAELFDWEAALVVRGHSGAVGRARFRAIGRLGNDLVTLVFSPLGSEAVSVMSLRPASRGERKLYDQR